MTKFILIVFSSASFSDLHPMCDVRAWEPRARGTLHEFLAPYESNPVLSMSHIHESCNYMSQTISFFLRPHPASPGAHARTCASTPRHIPHALRIHTLHARSPAAIRICYHMCSSILTTSRRTRRTCTLGVDLHARASQSASTQATGTVMRCPSARTWTCRAWANTGNGPRAHR